MRLPIEWKAVYSDGTFLSQYNSGGSANKYTDINRSKLTQFHLTAYGKTFLIVHLNKNKRLIYRMRVAHHMALGPSGKSGVERVWLVGWQEKRRGVNVQMVCAVFEDGHIEVVDRFREGHPWFYPVNFRPEEAL